MARNIRNPRFPTTNTGKFNELIPCHKAMVVPGETMKRLSAKFRTQTIPVTKSLTGAYYDVWYFYVPFRLAVNNWENFILHNEDISLEDTAYDQQSSHFFNLAGIDQSSSGTASGASNLKYILYMQCYEKIVNDFFRADIDGTFTFAGVPARIHRPDLTSIGTLSDIIDTEVDVALSTSQQASAKNIQTALEELKYKTKMDSFSGKYADFLRLYGVNASEGVLQMPEYLGKYRKFLWPSKSINQSSGNTVQSFMHDCSITLNKPRYFSEHGYVIGVKSIRPKLYNVEDLGFEGNLSKAEHFFPPISMPESETINIDANTWMKLGEDTTFDLKNMLYKGHPNTGNGLTPESGAVSLVGSYNSGSLQEARIPPASAFSGFVASGSSQTVLEDTDHFQFDGVNSMSLATPVKKPTVNPNVVIK